MGNKSSMRSGENGIKRFLFAYYLLGLHAMMSLGMVLFMKYFVHGKVVNPDDGIRSQHGRPWFKASDITTLVSAYLTAIRIVVTSWSAMSAWRCAFLILEDVDGGYGPTLQEFNRIVSWKVHWPSFSWNNLSVAAILLAMVPSGVVAPVLSGSVGWKDSYIPTDNHVEVGYNSPTASDIFWYWYIMDTHTRKDLALRAAGFSTLSWANTINKDGDYVETCRHTMTTAARMPINSTIYNVTIPCLEIHNISWDTQPDKEIQDILGNSSKISLINETPLGQFHQGNAALFDTTGKQGWEQFVAEINITDANENNYNKTRLSATFTGVKKVAVLLVRQGGNCSGWLEPTGTMFGSTASYLALKNLYYAGNNCYRVGSVNFTAGVIRGADAKYISSRTIEASYKFARGGIQPDQWVVPALHFLPDVMERISGMNATSVPPWDNMDGYIKGLVRQAYMGIWDAMNEDFDPTPVKLRASETARLLEAVVGFQRVAIWFGAQLLLTVSGLALWALQKGHARPVVIDPAAVALMTDVGQILQNEINDLEKRDDPSGLTGMSYVRKDDCKGLPLQLVQKDNVDTYTPRFELQLSGASGYDSLNSGDIR